MKKRFQIVMLVVAFLMLGVFAGSGLANDYDCAAYDNYAGAEPAGYAENCLTDAAERTSQQPVPLDPTDTAYFHDLRNSIVGTHVLNDFPGQTMTCTPSGSVYAYDYNVALDTLYAVDATTVAFGTYDGATCAFTSIGPVTGLLANHSVSGLTTDPMTGDVYASSTDITTSALYSVDTSTGAFTLIGSGTTAPGVIDLSMNCNGQIYANDIVNDSIYTIDPATGAQTLVGAHGLATNFAQGMDFDNADGTLYIYAYTGGGTNTYGTVDLVTGAITPLSVDNPLGEYEGATQTSCGGPTPDPTLRGYRLNSNDAGVFDVCWYFGAGRLYFNHIGEGRYLVKELTPTYAKFTARVGGVGGWTFKGITRTEDGTILRGRDNNGDRWFGNEDPTCVP